MNEWMDGSSCFSAAYTVGTVLVITGNPNAGWGWGRGGGLSAHTTATSVEPV